MSKPVKFYAYCVDCRELLRDKSEIHQHLQSRCCISIWPDKPRNPGFKPGHSPARKEKAS
jgi:hypothetical protein